MKDPWDWKEEDIQGMIDNEVEENINLDYTSCDALQKNDKKKNEISIEVSSFANAAGGTIIYGVIEDKKKRVPVEIDVGFEPADISKEWLENIIITRIKPKIEGLRINPIKIKKTGRVIYAVYIPQSDCAHQASDHKFYRRYNFQAEPMDWHEIQDVDNRKKNPKVSVKFGFQDQSMLSAKLVNEGFVPAYNIYLEFMLPERLLVSPVSWGPDWAAVEIKEIEDERYKIFKYHHHARSGPLPLFPDVPAEVIDAHRRYLRVQNEEHDDYISWEVFADQAEPQTGKVLIADLRA